MPNNQKVLNDEVLSQKRILTYGTFDLLHFGHIRLLRRAAKLGNFLCVGLSTDSFNQEKGKDPFYPYEIRLEMLESLKYVDQIFAEETWNQKRCDIERLKIDVVVMGSDWEGSPRFEELRDVCEVIYLQYTKGISSTELKKGVLGQLQFNHLDDEL